MHFSKRLFVVFFSLTPSLFFLFLYRHNSSSKKFTEAAQTFRKKLQQLGTTYIKLGQMLSSRPDLIGLGLADELRNLLDNEPPIVFTSIHAILLKELGEDYKKFFTSFEENPLATASIAQVHKAVLKNGKKVALKIQRPYIEEKIQNDLQVLQSFASLLDKFVRTKNLKISHLFEEFKQWLENELDFEVEGKRADKFRENMKSIEGITIPKIYWEHTTKKVLVMEFIEGHTLNELLNEMKKEHATSLYDIKIDFPLHPDALIQKMITAVAHQALIDKFFHGDLHPANIIVQKHNHIAFVDFGIIGTLDAQEHTHILFTMLALVDSDPEALLKVISAVIQQPLTQEEKGIIQQEIAEELHKMHEDMSGKISLNHFMMLFISLSQKYQMLWSPGFILVMKSLAQIDSVASQIGLKQPLVDLMKPEVEKVVTQNLLEGVSKETVYKTMLNLLEAGKELPQTLTDLQTLIHAGQLPNLEPAMATIPNI